MPTRRDKSESSRRMILSSIASLGGSVLHLSRPDRVSRHADRSKREPASSAVTFGIRVRNRRVAGSGVITHPEKVLFPDESIIKGELASYYDAVASVMLPHVRARPVTMERYPSGIAKPGFMQKDVSRGYPEWLTRVEVPKKGGTVHHPLVCDRQSLLWLANQNCITPHVWTSRAPNVYRPDVCVFDLDPS